MQRFAKKKASGKLKIENENFGNKTFQSAELRKSSVLEKKKVMRSKKSKNENFEKKTKKSAEHRKCRDIKKKRTLEKKHYRGENSGKGRFYKKKTSGKIKIEK